MGKVDFINKENLRIARENIGMSTSFVSGKFNKSGKDVVASWESGEDLPTWRQVSVLAKTFNISELLFFSNDIIKQNPLAKFLKV